MFTLLRVSIFVIFAALAFGELSSNSVTVTATNTANLVPDQAVIDVVVNSGQNSTLNDILTAVQPAGLTVANLSGVGSVGTVTQPNLQWGFGWAVPLAQVKTAIATLTGLEQSVPQANPNLSVSFSIQGTQVSQQLQQSQSCSYADLLASARAQAQILATAGGRTLSGVLAMSSATSAVSGLSASSVNYALPTQSCSLTVKFALLGL